MDGRIDLTTQEHKVLLQAYRSGTDTCIARRAHVLLLRANGLNWQQIKDVLFCSFDLISHTLKAFADGGLKTVLEQQAPQHPVPAWIMRVLRWVTQHTPRDFRYFRSRWSRETLAHLLAFETAYGKNHQLNVTNEAWTLKGLVTYYILFAIELKFRRVKIVGVTTSPNSAWITQVARNLTNHEDGFLRNATHLILDRDTKFLPLRTYLKEHTKTKFVLLPPRSPNLNSYAERFVRTLKSECLDRMIFFGEASLRRAL